MELVIRNVSKHYGTKKAVNQVSLTLGPGIYGLLGANGAGKTTLMSMICGLLKPTGGSIQYNGKNIDELGNHYANLLGYLPQGFGYYPNFTGRDFLLFMAAVKGINAKFAKVRTEEMLKLVGLESVANKNIRTYSGGMKQRLGIAQALLNDPEIIVLDEPTAGLDPKERIRFRNILTNLSRNKILILSTHIVSDIESIADQIIMLKKGQVIVKGTVDAIIAPINDCVWQGLVLERQLDVLMSQYCVSHQRHMGEEVQLRIISEEKPFQNAEQVQPTLEDVYIYTYRDEMDSVVEVKSS